MDRRRRNFFLGIIFLAGIFCVLSQSAKAQSASTWNKRGLAAEQREDYDAAFEAYRQARLLKPGDLNYKTHFERMRFQAAAAHVDRGRVLRQNGDVNAALAEFQRAIAIDGGNQAAQQEIVITQQQISSTPTALDAPAVIPAAPSSISAGPIELQPVSTDPITLHSVEDTKNIYQAIGKLAGLNVIFDPDYTSKRIQVDLNNVGLSDALRIVGVMSGTFWKPVTGNTIFVAQNTRTKRTDLDTMAVQTFYLTNAAQQNDANEVLTALRNVMDQNVKVFLVPSQNAIVMRATPDQLLLAQELMNNLDRAKAEVVVDVAVLEVNKDHMTNLGIQLPGSFSITPQTSNATTTTSTTTTTTTTTSLTLNNLAHLNGTNFAVSIGSAALAATLSDSDTRVLQNPRLRSTDGQRAQLKIGQRIPVATGSYNSGVSTGVASVGVQTQFQYIDIGVQIDLTPTVHQNHEISLKMKIEVSTHANDETISGVVEPVIGQRISEQVIQLKEGEPSILSGILTKTESDSLGGTPGLSQIPLLGRIFSNKTRDRASTEIVFVLVPHIVRESVLTRMNTRPIDTGTGQGIELRREVVVAPVSADVSTPVRPTVPPMTASAAAAALIGANPGSAADAANAAQKAANDAIVAKNATGSGAPVNFTVTPATGVQAVGSTFQLAVVANNANDLYSVPLQVQFNPQVLQLVNVDSGELMGRDGQAVAVVHRDEGNGVVTISASRPPGVKGVNGQGSVAVLTFKAMTSGDSNVALTKVGAKNSGQGNLPAVGSQAVVHVK
nr:cohesin domain-containing protein [Terriglobus saanensis]